MIEMVLSYGMIILEVDLNARKQSVCSTCFKTQVQNLHRSAGAQEHSEKTLTLLRGLRTLSHHEASKMLYHRA
jgi:hypothetical protein